MKKLLATTYGITIAVVGLTGLLFVATLLPIPGNVQVKVVKSGSMEPAIHTGSIVTIKPEAMYAVGDVVTFGADTKTKIPTTHRIVSIQGEGASATYTTKGDANDTPDQVTTYFKDIEGKVLFTVPYAGYALAFARTKLGFFLLVGIPAMAVFIEEGLSIYRELRRRRMRQRGALQRRAMQEVAEQEPPLVVTPRMPDIRINKKVMGALAIVAIAGLTAAGGHWGSTLAYYANTSVSQGNSLQAGIFEALKAPALVLGAFTVDSSDAVVSDPEATSTSSDEASTTDEAESPSATPEEVVPADPDPSVEIATSSVTIE